MDNDRDFVDKNFDKNEMQNAYKNPRLYVGNLDYNTTVKDMRNIFAKYGTIVSIQIKNGFAFIEYEKPIEANKAREIMNMRKFNGRTIIVRAAMSKILSRSPSKSLSPTKRKEDVNEDDKNTCFFCGRKGHWKKDCKKRQKYIDEKIAGGELDQDYYGIKKLRRRSTSHSSTSSRRSNKRRKKRARSRKRSFDNSMSLSFSIPSDCSSCERILKQNKNNNKSTNKKENNLDKKNIVNKNKKRSVSYGKINSVNKTRIENDEKNTQKEININLIKREDFCNIQDLNKSN